ncbi:MAG: hypothetical protein M1834_002797 [Cirrosporium novae-zelandiae]|nr:MAG: hypothetical protein M1834_002797 [Cirrosporium novae-zelandiae]
MVSLWHSSKNEQDPSENLDGQSSASRGSHNGGQRHSEDATERTRLLPPRERPVDGYLDPDDPAVSPYNLWSVRALRYFTVLFVAITFIWWVLLLVSIFVSPPGMSTRGSGFFDFSYTTLTLGYLLIALLFFSVPSKAMEVCSLLLALLLLICTIIVLAVPRLREEEGWVGTAAVAWATLMAAYHVLQDRAVAWGKREEEQRLTGREETRRTLREWCAVLTYTVIMVILIIVAILLTGTLCIRARDATLEAPGKRYYVDGGKYSVHLHCIGPTNSSVTILLEGGENPVEDTFELWAYEAYLNGSIPRYCYSDRPGLGWSDNAPSPLSAGMASDALSEALALATENGPFIIVSAGVGGIYSRIFASRHGPDVKGILLVDALHEDYLPRFGNPKKGFLLWFTGIISPLGLSRLPAAIFKGRTREDRVYGQSAYQGGKFIKAKLQENLVADSLTHNELNAARNIQNRKTNLIIVSSGVEVRKSKQWGKKQEDLTTITDRLIKWDVVKGAKHEVWKSDEGARVLSKRVKQLVKAAE